MQGNFIEYDVIVVGGRVIGLAGAEKLLSMKMSALFIEL
jgi:hypothetical protein